MELKTKIHAEDGKQDMQIIREFDIPLELLFKAYEEADIFEQWMGTKVLKMESKKHGSYEFATSDDKGNVVFKAGGVIHEFVLNHKITRTFEMENAPFGAQLEFLEFEKLTDDTSRLRIHIVYRSVALRDQLLQLPFAKGLSMAHDRLQNVVNKLQSQMNTK